jgi:NADH-quinone oxidoreductase subunit K
LYATLARRNAIAILMGVELMLNAVNLNLVAFWRFLSPMQAAQSGLQTAMAGQAFTVFVFVVAAAEVAVGLALVISIYRSRQSVIANDAATLQG